MGIYSSPFPNRLYVPLVDGRPSARETLLGGPPPAPPLSHWYKSDPNVVRTSGGDTSIAQSLPPGVPAANDDRQGATVDLLRVKEREARDPHRELIERGRGYPKDPNALVNGSPLVTELMKEYPPDLPRHHRYEFKDFLCRLDEPGCTPQAAYDALRRHAVPGTAQRHEPVLDDEPSEATFVGVGGGKVRTRVEPSSLSIVNITEPNHVFHRGFVQRQIVVEEGKVLIRTFGMGNNRSPDQATQNALLARPAFAGSTEGIRRSLRPRPFNER
jgi:hypothetical protein